MNAANQTLLARASHRLGPQLSLAIGLLVLAVLAAMPLLHLLPGDHALHVSAYTLTLVGKILCYCIVALALDLVCLLYTSPSPRDQRGSRMPSSA